MLFRSKRGWDIFEPNGGKLLEKLTEKKLAQEFDFNSTYPYVQMLKEQIAGKNNSWAIRWYASAFLADKLTLYPGKTLIKNIGYGNSGTHCGNNDPYKSIINESEALLHKIEVTQDLRARKKFEIFFKKSNHQNFLMQLKTKFKRILH